MYYAIISVGDERGEGLGAEAGQGVGPWGIPEPQVPADELGQVLKRYKNRLIMVVDAEEAADIVGRLNQGGGRAAGPGPDTA